MVCLGAVDLSIDIDIRERLAVVRTTSRGCRRVADDGTAGAHGGPAGANCGPRGKPLALCYGVLFIPDGKPWSRAIEQAKADLLKRFPRSEQIVLVYTPLAKQAPSHEGKAYPGMVVVGEFLDWQA